MTWDQAWEHMKWLYERSGRAYTVEAARWYEANEPWNLTGLQDKVRRAIDKKEAARKESPSCE